MKERKKVKLLSHVRLFVTPVDCSLPSSSIHGISQARILEWVAISFSRGSSQPRDWTWVSRTAGRRFNLWATREASCLFWTFTFLTLFFLFHVRFLYSFLVMCSFLYMIIYISTPWRMPGTTTLVSSAFPFLSWH